MSRRERVMEWLDEKSVMLGAIFIVGQAVVFSLLPVWI